MNPWITNNFLDSCAFDPKYDPEDQAATEVFRLHKEQQLGIRLAHSVQKEVDHPGTPAWVKRAAQGLVHTGEVSLTPVERTMFQTIHAIVTGNGKPESVLDDARHIFEAQKYGAYFVTTDNHLLGRAEQLRHVCSVEVVLPSEFLAIVRRHPRLDRAARTGG